MERTQRSNGVGRNRWQGRLEVRRLRRNEREECGVKDIAQEEVYRERCGGRPEKRVAEVPKRCGATTS